MIKDILIFVLFLIFIGFVTVVFGLILKGLEKHFDIFITYQKRKYERGLKTDYNQYYNEITSEKKRFYFLPLFIVVVFFAYLFLLFKKILKIDYIYLNDFKYYFCVAFSIIIFLIVSYKVKLFEGYHDKYIAYLILCILFFYMFYTFTEIQQTGSLDYVHNKIVKDIAELHSVLTN